MGAAAFLSEMIEGVQDHLSRNCFLWPPFTWDWE